MSGSLPIDCPLCGGKTRSRNRKKWTPEPGWDKRTVQYRRCSNPDCLYCAKSIKVMIDTRNRDGAFEIRIQWGAP